MAVVGTLGARFTYRLVTEAVDLERNHADRVRDLTAFSPAPKPSGQFAGVSARTAMSTPLHWLEAMRSGLWVTISLLYFGSIGCGCPAGNFVVPARNVTGDLRWQSGDATETLD